MLRFRSALPGARSAWFSPFLLLVVGSFLCASALAKKPKNSSATPKQGPAGLKDIPLTVGHEAKGLVLPNYDLQGHLLGRFEAGMASRLDDDHVRFTNLKMITYDAQEKPDYTVDMTEAVLNLETRVINSKARTMIKRADFEIAGDAMQFSTLTHQGTLTGNVHMTIYKQSDLTGKPQP